MYSSDELFISSQEDYFGVYFPSCEIRHSSTYIILILDNITTIKATIYAHRPRVSLVHVASHPDARFENICLLTSITVTS